MLVARKKNCANTRWRSQLPALILLIISWYWQKRAKKTSRNLIKLLSAYPFQLLLLLSKINRIFISIYSFLSTSIRIYIYDERLCLCPFITFHFHSIHYQRCLPSIYRNDYDLSWIGYHFEWNMFSAREWLRFSVWCNT